MTMNSKIADQHLARQACIYIRQSTMGQVRFNQESTERQYNLKSKAESLGWKGDQIRILDRDLGQSGSATTNREDFKALVGEVAMGRVVAAGAIEPGLASPPGTLRHHQHARDRRGWLLQSGRVQRWACIGDEGHVRPSGIAHYPRPPPWR